jgi:hypothetical protein
MGYDLTRTSIDSAVIASEALAASGEGTPAGIAALAALAPVAKIPNMVSDSANLVKDFHNGNTKAVVGDLLSLTGHTIAGIVGDYIALEQDQIAVANDLAKIFSIPLQLPTPPSFSMPSPAPTPASSLAGTYSATLIPNPDSNVQGTQTVTLTLNADGSGSASVSPFLGKPLTYNFPAGTAQLIEGINGTVLLDYVAPSGDTLFVNAMQNANGSLSCSSLRFSDGHAHYTHFDGAILNK